MKKTLFTVFWILFANMLSSCSLALADRAYNATAEEIDNTLIGDGKITWVLDKDRSSRSLGNDPDSECISTLQFEDKTRGQESDRCVDGGKPQQAKPNEQAITWKSAHNALTLNGQEFDVAISSDKCLISLMDKVGKNLVFKREPQPKTGCTD